MSKALTVPDRGNGFVKITINFSEFPLEVRNQLRALAGKCDKR
jgi:hypothetical protein